MKTHKWQLRYVEWLSAEEMYEASKNWESELGFIHDEQLFFEHLLQKIITAIPNPSESISELELIGKLEPLKKECNVLYSEVISHQEKLSSLVDGVHLHTNEAEQKQVHYELMDIVGRFYLGHQQFKKRLFAVIKSQLKVTATK
ncbi:hypothetical protein RQM59_01490 [Flavobacteriaceae bacterium S356]|uniref:Hemerythrin-like domain-containing protein n=1 Tax=Asprobacillus argus TaxID=3076534 RepID=A0ABU3LBI5_9FLAO|nr:hypothetical protein [Flavobacteriaceae bacterium S356]